MYFTTMKTGFIARIFCAGQQQAVIEHMSFHGHGPFFPIPERGTLVSDADCS
jgi:hypothetical protein